MDALNLILAEAGLWGAAYWACLIVGGGLVLVSALSGHHSGADAPADFHLDAGGTEFHGELAGDAHLDSHHASHANGASAKAGPTALSNWFSLRFVVFALAVFGFVGVVLTYLTPLAPLPTLGISLIGGVAVGQTVHQLIRKLDRSSGNSAPEIADYLNKPARVTLAFAHPQRGEIALTVRDVQRFLPAVSKRPDQRFGVGEEVFVIGYRGGFVEVVSRADFEFLTRKGV